MGRGVGTVDVTVGADVERDGEPAAGQLPAGTGPGQRLRVLDREVHRRPARVPGEQLVVEEAAGLPGLLEAGRGGGGPQSGQRVPPPPGDRFPGQVRGGGKRRAALLLGIGGGLGLVLPGPIMTRLSYQWLFWLALVVIGAALVLAARCIPADGPAQPGSAGSRGALAC